ncbi:MAG: S1 RNA-binding domain-containing protein [Cyanobacteria bacterium P01_A01_bin.40]
MNTELTEWEKAKCRIKIGSRIKGIVKSHKPFGIFVNIGDPIAVGLVQIADISNKTKIISNLYPPIDTEIEAEVIAFTDERRKQVWLTMKNNSEPTY